MDLAGNTATLSTNISLDYSRKTNPVGPTEQQPDGTYGNP